MSRLEANSAPTQYDTIGYVYWGIRLLRVGLGQGIGASLERQAGLGHDQWRVAKGSCNCPGGLMVQPWRYDRYVWEWWGMRISWESSCNASGRGPAWSTEVEALQADGHSLVYMHPALQADKEGDMHGSSWLDWMFMVETAYLSYTNNIEYHFHHTEWWDEVASAST